eukprot:m.84457 g.84457  ORF g.84457 m.84457 type:complete len:770 (+) comp12746_c2_seq1:175-2484(+)
MHRHTVHSLNATRVAVWILYTTGCIVVATSTPAAPATTMQYTDAGTDSCSPNPCHALSECVVLEGQAYCEQCQSGYEGDGLLDGNGCSDVDECKRVAQGLMPEICDPLASCVNTEGSYTCGACPTDYHGTGRTGCIRIPSIDVDDDVLVILADASRDIEFKFEGNVATHVVSVQSVESSLSSLTSTIRATEDELGSELPKLASVTNALSTSQGALSSAVENLAGSSGTGGASDAFVSEVVGNETSRAQSVEMSLETKLSQAQSSIVVREEQHQTLAQSVDGLQTELESILTALNTTELVGNMTEIVLDIVKEVEMDAAVLRNTTTELQVQVNAADTRLDNFESSVETKMNQLANRISSLETTTDSLTDQIRAIISCSQDGLVFDGNSCVATCRQFGDCSRVSSCSNTGIVRYKSGALEECVEGQFLPLSPHATIGLSEVRPATDCQQLQDLGFETGFYFIGKPGLAVIHYCNMTASGALDLGGHGLSQLAAASSCAFLADFYQAESGTYWLTIGGETPAELYCDMTTKVFVPDGSSQVLAAYSCKSIAASYPTKVAGTKWIKAGDNTPFKVTCDTEGFIVVTPSSPQADNAWIISNSFGNSFYKCRCAANDWIKNPQADWYNSITADGLADNVCQQYYTWVYTSGGSSLTATQVNLIANLAKESSNRNFEVYAVSCDDDDVAAPAGNWIGVESSPSTNDFAIHDCTSGDGGNSPSSSTEDTGGGNGCCNKRLADNFQTYPFPLKICGSSNTGGGAGLIFSTNELKVREA